MMRMLPRQKSMALGGLGLAAMLLSSVSGEANTYGEAPFNIGAHLDALVAAYPSHLRGHNGREIIWNDGTKMKVSDGKTNKTFRELLNAPDIDDMFAFSYRRGDVKTPPNVYGDPGRIRYEPFFKKMYGDCKKGDLPKFVSVKWLPKHKGGRLKVTTVNGVDKALAAVSADLEKLPAKFVKYLKPSAGTFNCRNISGTKRLSVHAFAAAIDINVKQAHYWKWTKPNAKGIYPYRNKFPFEVVEVFEKHGFIWGGRWYHYDTMHFEYRPELLGN